MSKPLSWSHTALKDYEGCPRRYHEVRVLKKYPFQETEATRYGNDLHKAVELYIKDNTAIPEQYAFVKPVVDALLKKPGRKLAEQKMAVTVDLKPCDWFDKGAWSRGIADLLIIDDDNLTAWVADWKTGNNKYPDRDQLRLMSLLVFAHYPHVRKVNSALIFVVKDDMVKSKMSVDEFSTGWQEYRERVAKIEASVASGVWHPKQTPLCGWCPCTGCEHNPKH
jgi:RecB family exonuclease